MDAELEALRDVYRRGRLDETGLGHDPLPVVRTWIADALAAHLEQPNTMTLATVGPDGRPSARTVLLKGVDDGGFTFFTNLESRKGLELASNPNCALVLLWVPLARQIRVEGRAQPIDDDEADAYFRSRPRGHRLGAWASAQSSVIADRTVLEERLAEVERMYDGTDDIPRPPFWGGYRVWPDSIELWHGRDDRLHDRFRFTRSSGGWERARLSP